MKLMQKPLTVGHSTAPLLMSSMMSWGWRPSTLHPTDWAVPRISLMVAESSLAKDCFRICRGMFTISSNSGISAVLTVFLLLSVSWQFLERFDDQGRGRRRHLHLGLSALNGQLHCGPQSLPVTSCLGVCGTDAGGQSWGPGQMWHQLPQWCI